MNTIVRDRDLDAALQLAAARGQEQTVDLLLKQGARIDSTNKLGWTSLMQAARNGHSLVVAKLLTSGADIFLVNRYGANLLCLAAASNNQSTIITVIKAVSNSLNNGIIVSPLLIASVFGNLSTVKLLLDNNCDPNAASSLGLTPLMVAAASNNPSLVSLLVQNGALVNLLNCANQTAFDIAAIEGHDSVIQFFKHLYEVHKPYFEIKNNQSFSISSPKSPGSTFCYPCAMESFHKRNDDESLEDVFLNISSNDELTSLFSSPKRSNLSHKFSTPLRNTLLSHVQKIPQDTSPKSAPYPSSLLPYVSSGTNRSKYFKTLPTTCSTEERGIMSNSEKRSSKPKTTKKCLYSPVKAKQTHALSLEDSFENYQITSQFKNERKASLETDLYSTKISQEVSPSISRSEPRKKNCFPYAKKCLPALSKNTLPKDLSFKDKCLSFWNTMNALKSPKRCYSPQRFFAGSPRLSQTNHGSVNLGQLLQEMHLEEFEQLFNLHELDIETFLALEDDDLRDMGIHIKEKRNFILGQIHQYYLKVTKKMKLYSI